MRSKIIIAFGLLTALQVSAAIIIDPVSATANYEQGSSPGSKLVDGSGLSDATIVETGDAIPALYPTHSTSAGDMWRTLRPADGHPIAGAAVTFDLGAGTLTGYDLTGFHLWNYNEFWSGGESSRGIQTATIEYSTDDGGNWTSLGNSVFTQATESSAYAGEDYSFGSTLTGVTDVRFTVVDNWGGDRVGLSEVRFVAIPEPASLGLIGVFSVGTFFIRRRLMM